MDKKILLEIIWGIVTVIAVILFILPIYNAIGDKYNFYTPNIFYIIVFITFTRLIFLLQHTLIAKNRMLKLAFVFIPIPLFFYTMDSLFDFQNFLDNQDHIRMVDHLSMERAIEILDYTKYQFLFFAIGTFIVLFLLPVRMIISIWRGYNKGTI